MSNRNTILISTSICTAGLLLCLAALTSAQSASSGTDLFERRIRPLLVEKCYGCHSAQSKPVMGALRLDSKAGLLTGGSHGAAIVPGDPDKSLLVKAVRFHDDKLKMPPAGKLRESEIAALVEWIKLGAPDPRTTESGPKKPKALTLEQGRRWWAFQPLRVQGSEFRAQGGIDSFVLAKLREKRLSMSPPAGRRTLIRRAYLDLIGLPPTPEEVEAFVNDQSPNAWDKVIDRLLANPHYGERWGRHWLDLARFAESHGYEQDYDRPNAYHYRDFVIKALNQDMPFNTFCRWQIAGDEIEPENPLALAATGFLAAGTHATQITKNQVEKERYDELDDMLSTTTTSMLAVTTGCARCHDHKFDPIPNRDYYRMLSTFTTTVRSDYDVNLDPAGYRAAKETFDKEHAPYVERLKRFESDELVKRLDDWVQTRHKEMQWTTWQIPEAGKIQSAGEATLTVQPDGSFVVSGKRPDTETYTFVLKTNLNHLTGLRLDALADPSLARGGPGRADNGNFALSDIKVGVSKTADGKPEPVKIVKAFADFEQKGLPVAAAIDSDPKTAWAVDPEFGKDHTAIFRFDKPVMMEGGFYLTVTLKFEVNTGHAIARPRVSVTSKSDGLDRWDGLDLSIEPEYVGSILERGGLPSPEDRTALLKWFRTIDPGWQKLNGEEKEHLAKAPKPLLQKTLISSEGVTAIRTHTQGGDFLEHTNFLKRGDPNQKGEVATQSFLQVLVRAPDGEHHWQRVPPKGWRTSYQRMALADWITDVDNGAGALLARVIVNRLWQHHMGRGIVATPSDFGTQGERPTHPELLEWLASELIRNGWKLKPIHKLIMTSKAYMQSSTNDPSKAKIDRDNKLCWRFNRRRLEAEIVRDSMLSVSGQLDDKMFGPGTLDESMKRRSIYFFVKRSRLIPSLALFDSPNALLGLGQRASTIIAPQALMLMNSPQVREYANAFAKRAAAPDPRESITKAYNLALSRNPTTVELNDSIAFLERQAATYPTDSTQSALADLCQALFCLNEFMYVD